MGEQSQRYDIYDSWPKSDIEASDERGETRPGDPGEYARNQVNETLSLVKKTKRIKNKEMDKSQDDDWRMKALCRGEIALREELFFPPPNERKIDKEIREGVAKEFCGGCAVRHACLDEALMYGDIQGVWGGTTQEERKNILRNLGRL